MGEGLSVYYQLCPNELQRSGCFFVESTACQKISINPHLAKSITVGSNERFHHDRTFIYNFLQCSKHLSPWNFAPPRGPSICLAHVEMCEPSSCLHDGVSKI